MILILIIVLIIVALGGLPPVGMYNYGYNAPSGFALILIIILIVLLLRGRL